MSIPEYRRPPANPAGAIAQSRPEIVKLAALLDMTPTDPTKVVRAAIAALTGNRETTLSQAREIMIRALDRYEEHG